MAGPNANLPDGQQLVGMPFGNDTAWYVFTVNLSAVTYTVTMRYNTRMSRWIMDLATAANVVIVTSIPLLILRNLSKQYAYLPNFPVGTFFCTDETHTDTQPTRLSFGLTNSGWYLDPTATS